MAITLYFNIKYVYILHAQLRHQRNTWTVKVIIF